MNMRSVKQLIRVGIVAVGSPFLLAGLCAAADTDTQDAQGDTQDAKAATLNCTNREILTWCFANNAQNDALTQCERYTRKSPELDGCIGGSSVTAACESSYYKIAAYQCP
jgi:hypothetical protein